MRERVLLTSWRHGNPVAGRELIDLHTTWLRRYLVNVVGLAHADRLTKQVFDRGLAVARWEDPKSSFRDLLLVVSEDVAREHVHSRCRLKNVTLLARARQGRSSEWSDALAILPLELQIVIELCIGHGVEVRLAASILEQSRCSIRRKLTQGRRLLTLLIEEQRARAQAEQLRKEREQADAMWNRGASGPQAAAPVDNAASQRPIDNSQQPQAQAQPPRAGFQWWSPQIAVASRAP